MDKVSFSVITPVHNREDCINRCMHSVAIQKYSLLEHIVINDGSTDLTEHRIKTFATNNKNVKILCLPQNKGVAAARNLGIKQAKGKFIIFLDSDDQLVGGAVDNIVSAITGYPEYLHYLFLPDDRTKFCEQSSILDHNSEIQFIDWLKDDVSGDFIHVMDRHLLRKFPFDENLRIYEGLTFLRIFKESGKQLFTKQVVAIRERNRFDSVTKNYRMYKESSLLNRYRVNKEIYDTYKLILLQNDADVKIKSLLKLIVILGLALGFYKENKHYINELKKFSSLGALFYYMNSLRLKLIVKWLIYSYSYLKTHTSYSFKK